MKKTIMIIKQNNSTFERLKLFRRFFYDYGRLGIFALALACVVFLSYRLSRLIPVDVFEGIISPIMHGAIFVASVVGAILVYRHAYGISARLTFVKALIWFAILEAILVVLEKAFGVSTLIYGVRTLDPMDMVMRDVFALLLLAYPMEVLYPRWLNWWRSLLLLLPAFVIWGLNAWTEVDMRILLIIYPVIIAGVLFSQIRVYRERCEDYYSSLENSAMKYLDIYLIILVLLGLSYFYVCFSNHPTRLFTQQWLVLAVIVFNTMQIVLREKPWQETKDVEAEEEEKTVEETAREQELRAKLDAWMDEKKPYLNKDFCLVQLMEVLPMNRTYLSKFINTEYGCSFYQYVTNYRIEEAKRLMKENPDMKLQDVAEKCGFSSPTVFGRTFRRETGMTPKEWS